MKKLSSLTALFAIACGTSLMACGTSAPTQASDKDPEASNVTDVGSASEAIRQLGKNDADVVSKCEELVQGCEKFAGDAGVGAAVCDRLGEHCTELAQQLSEARDQFQKCLEGVAACEASAASPADCRAQREACNPAGKDFQARRGATLACSERTQSCMPRMRGPGGRGGDDDDADAGANSCGAGAMDFVGCCHGHGGGHFGGDDAGVGRSPFAGRGAGAALPGFPGSRMTSGAAGDPRHGDKNDSDDADDADDADDNGKP
jgi:hypothetical protein